MFIRQKNEQAMILRNKCGVLPYICGVMVFIKSNWHPYFFLRNLKNKYASINKNRMSTSTKDITHFIGYIVVCQPGYIDVTISATDILIKNSSITAVATVTIKTTNNLYLSIY